LISPATEATIDTSSNFRRRQRRQNGRQPRRQHGFAGAGWPDHEQVVTAGRGDFERALGDLA
jgi:hypothetical protein